MHRVSLPDMPVDYHLTAQLVKHGIEPGCAADHGLLATDDRPPGVPALGDQGRRDIAATDVLGEGRGHDTRQICR